jgi:AcrR family transcriptional regulator
VKLASLSAQLLLHLELAMFPQREFKQARSAATYEALLAAAARVFGRRGFAETQTPEIAAEAGVSTGAFYRYFADKRACFHEVIRQHLTQAHESVMAKLTPERFVNHDPRQTIDAALDVLFDRIIKDAALERVFIALSFSDPDVRQMRAEYEARGCEALTALIGQIIPRERVPDPAAAARVVSLAAVETAADLAGLRPRVGTEADPKAMKVALREMIYRFMFAPESAPALVTIAKPARRPHRRR